MLRKNSTVQFIFLGYVVLWTMGHWGTFIKHSLLHFVLLKRRDRQTRKYILEYYSEQFYSKKM